MNIRSKWISIKTQLATELYRLNQMVITESDNLKPAGQNISLADIVSQLNIPYLQDHAGMIILCNADGDYDNRTFGNHGGSIDSFTNYCINKHCPISLGKVEKLIDALSKLTPEYIHAVVDVVLANS